MRGQETSIFTECLLCTTHGNKLLILTKAFLVPHLTNGDTESQKGEGPKPATLWQSQNPNSDLLPNIKAPTTSPILTTPQAARRTTYGQTAEGTLGWVTGESLSFLYIEGVGLADI